MTQPSANSLAPSFDLEVDFPLPETNVATLAPSTTKQTSFTLADIHEILVSFPLAISYDSCESLWNKYSHSTRYVEGEPQPPSHFIEFMALKRRVY